MSLLLLFYRLFGHTGDVMTAEYAPSLVLTELACGLAVETAAPALALEELACGLRTDDYAPALALGVLP